MESNNFAKDYFETFFRLADETDSFISRISATDKNISVRPFQKILDGLREELNIFKKQIIEDSESLKAFETVGRTVGSFSSLLDGLETVSALPNFSEQSILLSKGFDVGKKIAEKAIEYIDKEKKLLITILKDIVKVGEIVNDLLKSVQDPMKRLEQKLDSLQESVNGPPFPGASKENPGEIVGPLPIGLPVRELVNEVESKIELMWKVLLGVELPRENGKIPKNLPPEIEKKLSPSSSQASSFLWLLWDLELKLEAVFERLHGSNFQRDVSGHVDPGKSQLGESGFKISSIDQVLGEFRHKLDTLADLLGQTLVGSKWDVEPPQGATVVRGKENKVPAKSVKEEMHGLEANIDLIIDLIKKIKLKCPPCPPCPPCPHCESPQPSPLFDKNLVQKLKKIFVAAEGVFEPTKDKQSRTLELRSSAFDLGGWLDLTEMRKGDEISIALWFFLPRGRRRLWKKIFFRAVQKNGLKNINDIFAAPNIVGNGADLVIEQTKSGDAFRKTIGISYQIVLESQ